MITNDRNKLIPEIQKGSEKHFKMLFDAYWDKLHALANNTLDRPEDAEDVVQEIFIDIWNRRSSLQVDDINAYLYGCVRFGIAKKLKKTISHRTEEIFDHIRDHTDLESNIEWQDLLDFVAGRIEELPDRCREIFKLSRYEQLSNKEIAEKLNLSTSTVENQINKALKILKADDRLSNELTLSIVILMLTQH